MATIDPHLLPERERDATVVPLGSGRSLKTAAEALAALRLLGANPDGLTPERLGAAIGKSVSTARYLLNTLCQEGYATKDVAAGVHRLAERPPWGASWGRPAPAMRRELPERLFDAVTELYMRTRQRTYLAQWEDDATIIVDARGHQGLARIPDLGERVPLVAAHALAVTKALVAGAREPEAAVVGADGLHPYPTPTFTSTSALTLERERVRHRGVATDREELTEGFCCVGAPIVAPDGSVAASLAVSTPARRFAQEADEIARAVAEVAAAATRDWREHAAASSRGPTDEGAEDPRPPP